MDPTDTVALLSSHFVEIDLWPSVGNFALLTDIKDNSFEGVSPRVAFLKESKTVPELRHLENAVCDMRCVLIWFILISNIYVELKIINNFRFFSFLFMSTFGLL